MFVKRIDSLRQLVVEINRRQVEYSQFFPSFADRLVSELAEYLGDPACVALSLADGDFSFRQGGYGHQGLGSEGGKYRIPLMFRLKNLGDESDFLIRIRAFFTMQGDELTCEIDGGPPLRFESNDLAPLLEHIYQHLRTSLAEGRWFERASEPATSTQQGTNASSPAAGT